jgi:hypothetical protein
MEDFFIRSGEYLQNDASEQVYQWRLAMEVENTAPQVGAQQYRVDKLPVSQECISIEGNPHQIIYNSGDDKNDQHPQ